MVLQVGHPGTITPRPPWVMERLNACGKIGSAALDAECAAIEAFCMMHESYEESGGQDRTEPLRVFFAKKLVEESLPQLVVEAVVNGHVFG
jgi:hypothetical protein